MLYTPTSRPWVHYFSWKLNLSAACCDILLATAFRTRSFPPSVLPNTSTRSRGRDRHSSTIVGRDKLEAFMGTINSSKLCTLCNGFKKVPRMSFCLSNSKTTGGEKMRAIHVCLSIHSTLQTPPSFHSPLKPALHLQNTTPLPNNLPQPPVYISGYLSLSHMVQQR